MPRLVEILTRREIQDLTDASVPEMTREDGYEMAIPSYTHGNPLVRWLMWRRCEEVVRLSDLHGSETVLEFGCGVGVLLPTLSLCAARVLATDLFPEYAKRLAAGRGLSVQFVEELEAVADGTLDVVIAADVMEHLKDPRAYARRFLTKLRPGGRLVVSGRTENLVYKLGRVAAGFAGKGNHHHVNIDRLMDDIKAAGFVLRGRRNLPFSTPPWLFKVVSFERPGPESASAV